jgi:protein-disulfide isomerase
LLSIFSLKRSPLALLLLVALVPLSGFAQDESPDDTLKNIPGMDFSSMPQAQRQELATVLKDQFCFCGCPHALGACLRQHTPCRHAQRMVTLAATLVELGFPATEITNQLSTYFLSFKDTRADFKVDARMCKGPKDAPVTVVEFFDFECPHCGKVRPMLEKWVAQNNNVRLCAVPFPLPMHPNAIPAGKVAFLAREKGKYWEVYDALFENQTHLTRNLIKEIGVKAGFTPAEVDRALANEAYEKEIRARHDAALGAGVEGTPTLFFNGHKLSLPVLGPVLNPALDDEIEWKAQKGAWGPDSAP